MTNDIIRSAKRLPIQNMLIYYPQKYTNLSNMIHDIEKDTDLVVEIRNILISYSDKIVKDNPCSVFKEIHDNIDYENNLHIGFFVEGESKDCESAAEEARQLLSFLYTYKFNPDLPIFYYHRINKSLDNEIQLTIIKEFMDTIKNNSNFKVGFCTEPKLFKRTNTDIISEYDYLAYADGHFTNKVYDPVIVMDNTIDCVGWIYGNDKFKRYNTPTIDVKYAFLYTDYNVAFDHPIGDEAIISPKTGDIRFRKWISPREYTRNEIVYYSDDTFRIYGQDGLSILPSGQDICIKRKGHIYLISCDDDGYMRCTKTDSVVLAYREHDEYRYFLPNNRIEDIILEENTENKTETDIDGQIMIGLRNYTTGNCFGHCSFEVNNTKKSVDCIDIYLYNSTCNNIHHVIEYPLSLSINDLIVILNDNGISTDCVGHFENECNDYDIPKQSDKKAYSISDLIDRIYCSIPYDYNNSERMLFLYRSYFEIILKKLIPGYYITDPISGIQAVPVEAHDMIKVIDRMVKNTRHLSIAFRLSGILLFIVCIANILIYLFR